MIVNGLWGLICCCSYLNISKYIRAFGGGGLLVWQILVRFSAFGRRNRGRPLKRLLDTWDRNGPTSGLIPWQTYDDDDEVQENTSPEAFGVGNPE